MMTMKLSDRFNSTPGSVACVVSLRELAESKEIDIPDVQRGLVWNPTQIANLWKSIFAGYPIGALTLYEQEGKWQLIDGQQRWHAIKLGLSPTYHDEMTSIGTIWKRNEDNSWEFDCLMVYTRRHPWGFRWDGDKLKRLDHDKMVAMWNGIMKKESISDSFILPTLQQAASYMAKSCKMIPLHQLLSEDDAGLMDDDDADIWELAKEWRERVNVPSLPLIRFDLKQGDSREQNDLKPGDSSRERNRIQELFTRINKGGTPISNTDLTYSTLCSYMGSGFKQAINTVAEGFLPPSRVARLYARLKYTEDSHRKRSGLLVEPSHYSYWQNKDKDDNIVAAIDAAKTLLCDACIPASIYLSASEDEWLTVICWCMWKYKDKALDGSLSDKKLLCMLPYVVCWDPEYHKHFCERFYEALNAEELKDTNLLELIAIGVAYAACYSQVTGMYPLREPVNVEVRSSYDYDDEWLMACLEEDNKGVLHFLQTPYMNRLLQEKCGFYPHEPATWGELMNRPWDDDHIVPKSLWWRLEPEEQFFQGCLANIQMLYYRHNRSKSNAFIGVPEDASTKPVEDFCYPEAGLGEVKPFKPRPGALRTKKRDDVRPEYVKKLDDYKWVVNQRFGAMVQKLWSELKLADLVKKINDFGSGDCVPRCLQLAVERWNILKEMKDKVWCALRHDESRQQEIAVKDFYHSLCSWLAVGKVENGAFRCFCWHQVDARTLKIEAGWRRLPDMTQTEWLEGATKDTPRSAWWVEDGKFKDRIYVHESGSVLKNVVDSVKPHSGE